MKPLAALLVALALPLSAQESSLGARVDVVVPTGDLVNLTNGQVGVGVAVHISIPVTESMMLRPYLGFHYIPKGDTLGLVGTKTTVGSIDFMVDGVWFPGEDFEHGAYLVGAIGAQEWHISSSGTSPSTINGTRLGVNGGLGYQYSPRLGFELRAFRSPVSSTLTAAGLMVSATLKF
jgi:hypothetical protein